MSGISGTMHLVLRAGALMFVFANAAFSQAELSFYGGAQATTGSNVSGNDPGGAGVFGFDAGWQDQDFGALSQYGMRITWWTNDSLGWGFDFDRSVIRADDATLTANGLNALSFAGGINQLSLNAYRRWQDFGALTPYVGAGFGVSIPRVVFDAGGVITSEVQLTGPMVQWVAGASYPLSDRWSIFGEYKGQYSSNNVDLASGGSLQTNTLSSALNVGVSLGF